MHEGGDKPKMYRVIPRLHGGLQPDEYPAILQKGERVWSKKEVAAGRGEGPGLTVSSQVIVNDPRFAARLRKEMEKVSEETVRRLIKEYSY